MFSNWQSVVTDYPIIEKCTSEGWFPTPGTYCNSFYLCVKTDDGFILEEKNCEKGLMYNPVAGYCTTNFNCPEKRPEEPSTSLPSTPLPSTPLPEESLCSTTCPHSGMFSYKEDCTKYINCVVDFNYNVCSLEVLECPYGLHFNGQFCDETFKC